MEFKDILTIRPLNHLSNYLQDLVKGRLWLKVLFAIVLGAGLGFALNPNTGWVVQSTSQTAALWLDLPGQIFIKLVQMIMIPLIVASIITGIVSNVSENLKKFGLSLLIYFLSTTVLAIGIGVLCALIMEPGKYISSFGTEVNPTVSSNAEPVFTNVPDAISNLIPANPLQSILSGEMLSIVIFTIIMGVAITQLKSETARPLIRFMEAIQKICMVVVGWAMKLVPYAVFGLMAALISRTGADVFFGLGYYILVVSVGLIILMIVYLLLVWIITGTNPISFLGKIRDAQLLAFSMASSAAVMPLTMKTADEKLGISSNISDFVIPVGATINMDGTALFQCVTVIFLAQVYGTDLSVLNVLLITVTVVGASVGTPAIPGGGVLIMATVLQSNGIPAEGLVVIIGIDRILGMLRTAVNVTGDLTAAVIFNKWFGTKLSASESM